MREMKQSGIEWIGQINHNYDLIKLKFVVSTKITDGPHTTPILQDNGIPFLSAEAVKNGVLNLDYKRGYISEVDHEFFCQKCKPQRNDIFMVKSGATTGNIGIVDTDEEFSVWSPLALIRCDEKKAYQKFIYYALTSVCFKTEVELAWSYGTQQNIGMGVLENLKVISPPLPEQIAIANFLDDKCGKIDSLIENEEKAIVELKEYKKSIIQKATTKGISNAPLKDSGVEWIGNIPQNWQMGRVKNSISECGSGSTPESGNKLYYNDGTHFWIQSGDLYNTPLVTDTQKKITDIALEKCKSLQKYTHEFLVIAMYGASIGNVAISKIDAYVNQACYCLKTDNNNLLKYLYYYFEGNKEPLLVQSFGGTQPNINSAKIRNHILPIPPIDEQQTIAEYLDKKCGEVDELITKKKKKIAELKEYKKSLIYEYVTGKKEV
jgi:type I restriction enzyme S subunit